MSAVAVAGMIGFYQRWLSPLKGFSCAYRRERRRCSCSEFGRRVVTRFGLLKFVPLMRERFARCAMAAKKLTERKKSKRETCPLQPESKCNAGPSDCLTVGDCGDADAWGPAAECGWMGAEMLADVLT